MHTLSAPVGQEVLALVDCVDRGWAFPLAPQSPPWWRHWNILLDLRRQRFDLALNFSGADRTVGGTKFGTEYFHKSIVERWRDGWSDGTEKGEYRPKPLLPHKTRLDALAKGTLNAPIYPIA